MPRIILIVDDLATNRRILGGMLRKDYDILEAGDGRAALDVLSAHGGDVSAVLLDIVMPEMNGYEVLERMRADVRLARIPVIIVSGSEDEAARVRALALGADDFIIKPYSSELIRHCLRNNIALREAAATVDAMQRDRLTGLYNRDAFFQKAGEQIAAHEPGHFIMACFDIDKFKVINDQYGARKGDEVLAHVAETFRTGFEPHGGLCCRISADNFAVLYPASFQDSEEIAEIRERASHVAGLASPISFSIGRYAVDDVSVLPASMYDRAVLAVNTIKGRYDVRIAYYSEELRERLLREQELVTEMEQALQARQFEVWFQPQYNHSTDAMIGAEALVRWRHPQKGLISPGEFIPIFEQNGFIYTLDKYIWETVCRYLRKWLDAGRSPLPVSVNISRYDVFCPDLVEWITGLVARYGLPKELLRLEITESAFAESPQHIVDVVRALVDRGFTVEIDDFGSGYSSLNTLKDVPAQILKLDMKFLESSSDSQRGGNIVESVVRMAKWLGMSVIAEGVETLAQANYLRSVGCSYMQGYLYARPMPAEKYEEHCSGSEKEERLLTLETVENLDNNAFWDPESMDTLIFNSYVGGACIYEFHRGNIELIRATEKYAQVIGSAGMTVEDALKLNWTEHLDEENRRRVLDDLRESVATRKEVTGEYVFLNLPGAPHETHLRSTMRVIAAAGDRYLVYCTNENITAQRQSERREREVAEENRLIMKNIDAGVSATVVEDDRLRPIFANDRYYEQLGYERETYAAQFHGIPSRIVPEDREMVMERCRAISETGRPDCLEFRIERADGEIRWLRSNITVMDYPGEREPVQLSVAYDITEQLAAEQRIRMLSEQMQAIMDNVDLGIIAAVVEDDTARYVFANDHYYAMLGYTRAQFEEENPSPYLTIAQEDRQRVMEETARINATGESLVLTYSVVTRDGLRRQFRAAISMGRLSGVDGPVQLSILRDITEEVEAEQRERKAAEQIRAMMSDIPGGFVRMRVDPDGGIRPVYINEGLTRLIGMSREEVMDVYKNDALAGVHPDDVAIVRDVVSRMLANGEAHSSRYRLRRGNGSYIPLSIFGRTTTDLSGDTFLNVYYTDASEQVRAEETQRMLLDNLPSGAGIYEFKDGQMRLTYQNKSYWELVGLQEESYPDSAPMSAIHPDDVQVVMWELASAIEQRRDVTCDIRLRHLTSGYRPVHLVGRIVQKADGRVLIYATFTPNDVQGRSYQQMLPLLLSAIMESTTDLSFAKDSSFRYLTSSLAFARMAGQSDVRDVIGKTDYDLFTKELADKFRRDDEALLASGRAIVDMVEDLPSEDGAPRYSNTSKYILRDGSGEIIGLYGVGRDVTRSVVRDSQLRLVNDSVPGGLVTYAFKDNALHVAYCNDGFCKLFGGTREGFEQRGSFDPVEWVYEEDRPELLRQVAALAQDGTPVDCLFRVRVLGGGYKWINERAVVSERRDGVTLFNAVLLDVTERQNALERLRISEEENNLAVKLGGSVICRFVVADRTLTLSSDAAASYSLPETIDGVPYEPVRCGMVSPDTADAYTRFFESIVQGTADADAVATFQQQYGGGWRWLEARQSTVFSDDGRPVKAVVAFRDVTERLERETIYKKWQQSLAARRPDSYTLFRCNLNNDADRAAAEGELISFDFDNAGRDFNERARAYAMQLVYKDDQEAYAAFVQSDALLAGYYRGQRSGTLEYREVVAAGGVRWLRLTVELVESPGCAEMEAYLMYENIDEAKRERLQTIERSETDPLTGVLNRAAFAARVERIIRDAEPGEQHALLMLDIDGFKQINDVFGHGAGDQALIDLANGLRAAVRRSDLTARLGGDEFVVFLRGVPNETFVAAKAEQICALARRAFSLEVQISGSVGIAIAPRDGADFESLYKKADSALYYVKGSGKDRHAFYTDEMAGEHLEPERDEPGPDGAPSIEKKRRMLIVDDSQIDHELLKNIFLDEFIVEKARDGATALVRLRHYGTAISVVLLDLMMPGMDGFAVLEKMQTSADLRSIPVVIVSGDESRETCLKAIRKGATDYITKPVDPELLRLRVRSAVSRSENARLRAKNCLLEIQNGERARYKAVLESSGLTFVEYNWHTGSFVYYPSISRYLLGTYDGRKLWQILLSDMVADTQTVQEMQTLVHRVAEDRTQTSASRIVKLRTPKRVLHSFRLNVYKHVDEYDLTSRLILALNDLDYDASEEGKKEE